MSLKDNIKEVGHKIHEDEKTLVNVFRLEQFYKKYKILIFLIITIGIIFFVTKSILDYIEFNKNVKSHKAFLTLSQDDNNLEQISILKKNHSNLYELWLYNKAMKNRDLNTLEKLTKSKNQIIKDISSYHLSILKGEKSNSKIYKDLSTLNNVSILIKDKKFKQAEEQLKSIDKKSNFYQISQYFRHSIIQDLSNENKK